VRRVTPKDFAWRLSPPATAPGPPTWPAPETDVRVRWPAVYEWSLAAKWVDDIARGLERTTTFERAEIPQRYEGVVHFEVELDGRRHEVAIDYFDKHRLLDEVAERFPLVLKMQYAREGYGLDHVVPGGYVPSRSALYRMLGPARRLRRRPRRSEVYGRFSLNHAPEVRRRVVETLWAQQRFGYEGDLRLTGYADFLTDAATARVCVDLPGNGDMCHRLIEYLALGCCVVRPEPETRLHVDLEHDRHVVHFKPDASDVVDVCSALLEDEPRRERIAAGAREHFDRYLHRDQLAGYYLDRIVATLGRA
jgi:hypothetical protein